MEELLTGFVESMMGWKEGARRSQKRNILFVCTRAGKIYHHLYRKESLSISSLVLLGNGVVECALLRRKCNNQMLVRDREIVRRAIFGEKDKKRKKEISQLTKMIEILSAGWNMTPTDFFLFF